MSQRSKKKIVIRITRIAAAVICLSLIIGLVYYLWANPWWNNHGTSLTSETKDYSQEFKIPQVHSSHDADHDGIDDQIDMLKSARAYVAGHPRYKSKYYSGGYPTDRYGVCTDVLAAAFKGTGYDLRLMVDADIRSNLKIYGLASADNNIDYRRVKNLRIYFPRAAARGQFISLTTDVKKIKDWQGGDIVIFANHVALVSNKRDSHGIPYVIHLHDPNQKSYEQDYLPGRTDIVGHYRLA